MIDNTLAAVKQMTDKQLLDRVEVLSMQLSQTRGTKSSELAEMAMTPYVNELWVRNRGFNA